MKPQPDRERIVQIVREAIERAENYERLGGTTLLPELRTTRIANTVVYALDDASDEGQQ